MYGNKICATDKSRRVCDKAFQTAQAPLKKAGPADSDRAARVMKFSRAAKKE